MKLGQTLFTLKLPLNTCSTTDMKHLLSEAGGVRTYIEARPLTNSSHQGWTQVRIFTTAEWARQPDYEQTKVELFLQPEEFANLKAVINSL